MKKLPPEWRREKFRRPTARRFTRGYISFFEPDLFVTTAGGQIQEAGLQPERVGGFQSRYRDFSSILRTQLNSRPTLDFGIEMFEVYRALFDETFQFQRRFPPSNIAITSGDQVGNAFCELAYGMFPEAAGLDHIQQAYTDVVDPTPVVAGLDAWRKGSKGAGTPLDYTLAKCEIRYDAHRDHPIFIFDPLSGPDCIDAWNFRLFNRNAILVNSHWLEESRDFILEQIQKNYRPLPQNPNGVMIGTIIHAGRSLKPEAVLERLSLPTKDLPPQSLAFQPWYEPLWQQSEDDFVHRPTSALVSVKERELQLIPSQDGSIPAPVVSPDFDATWRGRGPAWVNVVKVRSYRSNAQFAKAMPSASFGNIGNYPVRSMDDQFPTREGFVTFHSYRRDESRFMIPGRLQAIRSWLEEHGFEVRVSEAGKIAEQVIESLGGLWGSRLIAHKEILRLLDSMARSRVIRQGGDSEEFGDSTAPAKTWIDTIRRLDQRRGFGSSHLLERLVDAGALQLGIATACSHCSKENWYGLDRVANVVECTRCRKSFGVPQGTPSSLKWKYRVAGPFATPHFAQGSYGVALTLAFLDGLNTSQELTYATSLELRQPGGPLVEADFFAWFGERGFIRDRRDPSTVVGECKSMGADAFKAQDVRRLKELGVQFPGCYLVVSTLNSQFSRGEIQRLRSVCRWGWGRSRIDRQPNRLIVLSAVELLGEGPIHHSWKAAGGNLAEVAEKAEYAHTLAELAQLTQRGYLGFSSDELWQMRYPQRAKSRPNIALAVSALA